MKRALLQNVKVSPYTGGAAIDKNNFLSAIFAASVTTAGALTLTVTHCDTASGAFTPAADTRLEANVKGTKTTNGVISLTVTANSLVNVDIDLVGCKQFVKIAASGAAATGATFAYALGDPAYAPV